MELLSRALSLVAPPFCWACGADAAAGEPLCRRCRSRLRRLGPEPVWLEGVSTWAAVSYEGPARALVAALKFRGATGVAGPIAAQMVAGRPPGFPPAGAALVPVPLHPARARRRGYNQAERIAAELARRTGLPLADCLRRRGAGAARQVGRGRSERLTAIAGAVELRPGRGCPPAALLVDDVVTTGATLAACAAALRKTGAEGVQAIAYARTPGR